MSNVLDECANHVVQVSNVLDECANHVVQVSNVPDGCEDEVHGVHVTNGYDGDDVHAAIERAGCVACDADYAGCYDDYVVAAPLLLLESMRQAAGVD
ncbi:hypothetical protein [Fictibacillus terranigra]|uniref:Uncharacterized protein n=1 Tax=Fictibacillus terranigra TaxID=3058424 RepID=A0ABT8EE05_9BACL|nr:hypothetical protein [Fictibacillus sp. CENA-BCM004]MDN4076054.1 hypothetical protein [Fictibacillus sp. CENA-BCM004]